MKIENEQVEVIAKRWFNLADSSLGAKALYVTDDFFAPIERLLHPEEPVWKEGLFDENGKWFDGWESRRKRQEGFDFGIVRLARPGTVKALDLYTRFFTGNYAPVISVEACYLKSDPDEKTEWTEIVSSSPLEGDCHNLFELSDDNRVWSHIRLNIFPDGGIARMRVYGDIHNDWDNVDPDELIDLSAALNGGKAQECSDEHFGAMRNLLMPGRGVNMGDGWETRRARKPNFDWVIISLGHAGMLEKIEIDTAHFKGNYAHQISINATYLPGDCNQNLAPRSLFWKEILPMQVLEMDKQHFFEKELIDIGPISHVRVNIFPDGGISRLRFLGHIDK